MPAIDEISRIIGGLETAVKTTNDKIDATNDQHKVVLSKLEEMNTNILSFKTDITNKVASNTKDIISLQKLRDRAMVILATAGIGGGALGSGTGKGFSKILEWFH